MFHLIRRIRRADSRPRIRNVKDLELFEAFCEFCGEVNFVEESVFRKIDDFIRRTGENPYFCENCAKDRDLMDGN